MIDSIDLLERISTSHRLLLVATLATTESAMHAWKTWQDTVNFDDIDGPSIRLLPLLAQRPDVVPHDDPLHGRVRGLFRKSWVSNEQLITSAAPVRAALTSAGVPLLHVEALTLANLKNEHAVRPLSDLDFCVPRASVRTANELLQDLGWSFQNQSLRSRWRHHPQIFVKEKSRIRLVQGVPWPRANKSAWETATQLSTGEYLLSPHDAVVHAAVRAQQHWQQSPVQWVADIALLTNALGYDRVGDARNDTLLSERASMHRSASLVDAALVAADQLLRE